MWIYPSWVGYSDSVLNIPQQKRVGNCTTKPLPKIREAKAVNSRWIAKRCLKWAVEYGSKLSGLAALYRNTGYYQSSFRVLTYHKITDSPKTTHDLSKKHFSEHVRILSNEYEVVSLPELVRGLEERRTPANGSVAITFDDGYSEISGYVAETLNKYGLTATFFVITGFIDGEVEGARGPYVSWDELRSMDTGGFSIGSHSVSHVSMNGLSAKTLRHELTHSFERIHSELGRIPCGFSYPYGTKRDFSVITREAIIAAGYPWAVTAIHGVNPSRSDHFSLKRINMTLGDGPKTLRLIMRGCLDAWELIDRAAYRLQRPNYKS